MQAVRQFRISNIAMISQYVRVTGVSHVYFSVFLLSALMLCVMQSMWCFTQLLPNTTPKQAFIPLPYLKSYQAELDQELRAVDSSILVLVENRHDCSELWR